jgi:hypothetical protein
MKTFLLPCKWTCVGVMRVDAETLDEAIEKAHDSRSLPDGDYDPDSFTVDLEEARSLNEQMEQSL